MARILLSLMVCFMFVGCGKNSAEDHNKNLKPVTGKVEDLKAGATGAGNANPGPGKGSTPP